MKRRAQSAKRIEKIKLATDSRQRAEFRIADLRAKRQERGRNIGIMVKQDNYSVLFSVRFKPLFHPSSIPTFRLKSLRT